MCKYHGFKNWSKAKIVFSLVPSSTRFLTGFGWFFDHFLPVLRIFTRQDWCLVSSWKIVYQGFKSQIHRKIEKLFLYIYEKLHLHLLKNNISPQICPINPKIHLHQCKDQIWLEPKIGMGPGPQSPNNKFLECGIKN